MGPLYVLPFVSSKTEAYQPQSWARKRKQTKKRSVSYSPRETLLCLHLSTIQRADRCSLKAFARARHKRLKGSLDLKAPHNFENLATFTSAIYKSTLDHASQRPSIY